MGTESDMEVVGEAANGSEALEFLKSSRPDVILMDLTMPVMNGLEATRIIHKQYPECLVIALTAHEDKDYFFEMLAAGAKGYITKQTASEELVSAIRSVAEGHVYLQPTLARWLLEDYQRLTRQVSSKDFVPAATVDSDELALLSGREKQVLELIADGLTGPAIARELELSPNTISRHRERIMKKLNLHSISELVKFALRTGLIEME
ncbi:response regulator transcription factor [bacterium]|nr:response regulator transcription factor [bacterium]